MDDECKKVHNRMRANTADKEEKKNNITAKDAFEMYNKI